VNLSLTKPAMHKTITFRLLEVLDKGKATVVITIIIEICNKHTRKVKFKTN